MTVMIAPDECLISPDRVCQRTDDLHRSVPITRDRFWVCPLHDL